MPKRAFAACAAAVCSCVALYACGGSSPVSPTPGGDGPGGTATVSPGAPAVVVAAGDVSDCGPGARDTGRLLDTLPGTLLALGDLAYMDGSAANFRECYDPAWGRHLDRTRPVPGNHEYRTPGAAGYFDYFGERAGPAGLGYYAFNAGAWRVIALNSEIPMTPGSQQLTWLRGELQNNRTQCTLAYWHRPLVSSGPNGSNPDVRVLWMTLAEFGADVVLNAHDHLYERFAPQDFEERPNASGIRQFIVGTGGARQYPTGTIKRNSEVRGSAYGVLVLTLSPKSYQWEFASVNNAFRDTGSGVCH